MKKSVIRSLCGVVAVLAVAGGLIWNASRPRLLDNDTAGVFERNDTVFLPEEQVPLAELPEEPDSAAAAEVPADPYEGLDATQIAYMEEVLNLVNQEREKVGVPALELDASLRQAAQVRAEECSGKFSHTRPNGTSYKTAITEAGLEIERSGENIATGYTSAEHVMQGWMNSSGHKANILNKSYTKIGIGLVENTGSYYPGYAWAQLFLT